MKKISYLLSFIMIMAVVLISSIIGVSAASSLPSSVTSDALREVEYIENYPVIVKTTDNGKYYVYCMNIEKTFAENIKFSISNTVDDGYLYILNNKPNTGDKDKDFYITQMAVWYYGDYLSGADNNLQHVVKQYILSHQDNDVCKKIYDLYKGARDYKAVVGTLSITDPTSVVWKVEKDSTGTEYYVSQNIQVLSSNLSGSVKYALSNAPVGTKIVKGTETNTVQVKVPVEKVPEGSKLTVTLKVSGSYNRQTAYSYYYNDKYQRVLFQDAKDTSVALSDSLEMTLIPEQEEKEYEVIISKTDVTQSKEIPGATLVVKDNNGNVVETWVSTSESHKIKLTAGSYSLTETIAPAGYKLSSTTIYFALDENGNLFEKDSNGQYQKVTKINMINELEDVKTFDVNISKTDITQSKEIPGATLVVKDNNGNVVETWVSTNESHKITVEAGKYSLTETIAPDGYKLSSTTIYFMVDSNGKIYEKNSTGTYVEVTKINMINELLDVVSILKKDADSDTTLAGAVLVIKDEKGEVVEQFTTTKDGNSFSLEAGEYTLSEVSAPDGYVQSSEVVYFKLLADGTLQVKNSKGEYSDSAVVTFYNKKKTEETIIVPKTDLDSTIYIISGIALVVSGVYFAKKTIKEC